MMEEASNIRQKSKHKVPIPAIITTSTVIVLAIFFGLQLIFKVGVFHQPGKVIFADSLTEENQDFINDNLNLNALELKADVTISRIRSESMLNPLPGADCTPMPGKSCETISTKVLYDILLPVTAWDSTETSISPEAALQGTLVSIWNLNSSQKLLALDGNYYLDDLTHGAFFEYLVIEGKDESDVAMISKQLQDKIATLPTKDSILTLAQTGVTALSRRMNTKLDQIKDAKYFAVNIGEFLSSFDLTHTSNEASFSQYASGANICAKPGMIDTLTAIGIDIIELTGNHNQDCGDADAIATVEQYHDLGIKTFGGGVSSDEAAKPLEISEKGSNITMLGYNLSTGGYTLDHTPGANFYTEEKFKQDVAAAKERGDFIIVDIQYYECNEYADTNENTTCDRADSAAGDQVGFFRSLIDMGANMVVGTSAHQPQTFEQYHGGTIYYGLGNLFFDQSAWPGTTRSLVLINYFWEGKLLQTRIVPTVYDEDFQTSLMESADAAKFIQRLLSVRPAA